MENGTRFHVGYEGRVVNKAAKSSWINGSADLMPHARWMMHVGVGKEAEMNVSPYFCHVPANDWEQSEGALTNLCLYNAPAWATLER